MKRLFIIVEGQTEEEFVKRTLAPYLNEKGIFDIRPILLKTSKTPQGSKKGGIPNFDKFKKEALRLLKKEKDSIVTSMIDFFRLPTDFPCYKTAHEKKQTLEKINQLEKCLKDKVEHPHFIPYIQMHEFEALVFAFPSEIEKTDAQNNKIKPEKRKRELQKIIEKYSTPEDINDRAESAPSKRLEKLIPGYQKILHGNKIIQDGGGIKILLQKCPHFKGWVEKIEKACSCKPD